MIALVPAAIIVSFGLAYALFLADLPSSTRTPDVLAAEALATHLHQSRKIATEPPGTVSESLLPHPYRPQQSWSTRRLLTAAGERTVTISDPMGLAGDEDARRLCRALTARLGRQTFAVLTLERAASGYAGCASVDALAQALPGVDLDLLVGPVSGARLVLVTKGSR
jgi:hypothetical protein